MALLCRDEVVRHERGECPRRYHLRGLFICYNVLMIAEYQPTIFPSDFKVTLSSVDDGNMKHSHDTDPHEVETNRELFLKKCGLKMATANLVRISYDTNDFCRYAIAPDDETGKSMYDWHDTEPRDALATGVEGRTLFLPVADCCALVLADAALKRIMLSHVGRHSAEQNGAAKSVTFMAERFGSRPEDILAWLSPAVGSDTYPLRAFGGKGLKEVIVGQLLTTGVPEKNIEVSPVDTAKDENSFSHSEYLKGHRSMDGRMAVTVTIEDPTV